MKNILGSQELNDLRREYSLYVISDRAIPHVTDGLKAAARRVLWKARDGKKIKSASLAGATMSIHPHAAPESAINSLAAFFRNNVPIFKGTGAFGTLLEPTEFGSSRYTAVQVSEFAKAVMFADLPIIPMVDNYDETELEPKHFLPLIPMVLLNPQEGIADGFACNILPRSLEDIIRCQIEFMQSGEVPTVVAPSFTPLDAVSTGLEVDKKGVERWVFRGKFERIGATSIRITGLPYGITHSKFIAKLDKLEETSDKVISYRDKSKDVYDIEIKFKRGYLSNLTDDQVFSVIGLETQMTENLNVIDFNSESVYAGTFSDIIVEFTTWRLEWYKVRYERLKKLLEEDIQKYRDILTAINNNVGSIARKTQSRSELKEFLAEIEIVNLDYIADLPVYRFTADEKNKITSKLQDSLKTLEEYNHVLGSSRARKNIYINELKEILSNYQAGKYS